MICSVGPRTQQESSDHQVILMLGLLLLMLAMAVSLYDFIEVREALLERKSILNSLDRYDDLAMRVKNWQLARVRSEFYRRGKMPKTEREFGAVMQAADAVERTLGSRMVQRQQFEELRAKLLSWNKIQRSVPDDEIQMVENLISRMVQVELATLNINGETVRRSLERNVSIVVLSFATALFLIFVSVRLKRFQELERLKTIEQLSLLKEKAESASALKSKFLSTVSHEIRTPLNGIIGLSEMLARSPPQTNHQPTAQIINQSGRSLLRIINDILDFSKIEANKLALSSIEFSLSQLVDQILLTLARKAAEKSIYLRTELDPNLPEWVKGDPDRLAQVLFNLVGNAIKFTSQGGVTLKIHGTACSTGCRVRFLVRDTGLGLSSEQIRMLFKPFVQIQRGGTRGEAGTGLGLSISKGVVEVMGGQIKVHSELGKGSDFSFELSFSQCSSQRMGTRKQRGWALGNLALEEVEPLTTELRAPRALVVEDNPTNQIVAQTMLEKLGVECLIAGNGKEALELLDENEVDVILMDCEMPELDGLEATRILRQRKNRTPIVAMTANAHGDEEILCREAGMNGFLTKPMDLETLRKELAAQLGRFEGFSWATLKRLDDSIGEESRKKVVKAFLSSTAELKTGLCSGLSSDDFAALHKLGHKFKSAARTVGGRELGAHMEELEKASTLPEARAAGRKILTSLARFEDSLREFS